MEKSTGHCTFCTGSLHHAHTCTHDDGTHVTFCTYVHDTYLYVCLFPLRYTLSLSRPPFVPSLFSSPSLFLPSLLLFLSLAFRSLALFHFSVSHSSAGRVQPVYVPTTNRGPSLQLLPLFLLYISSALFRDTPTSSYSVQVYSIIHKHKENVSKFSAFTRSRSPKSREISQCSLMISQSTHSVKSHHEFLVQSPVTYYDTWHGLSV